MRRGGCDVDLSEETSRGDAAAATWTFRGAPPLRLRRGRSVSTGARLRYYSGAMDYYTHVGGCGGRDLHFADGANQRGVVIDRNGTYSTHLFTERAVDVVSHHDATEGGLFVYLAYARRADSPRTGRGDAAAATWTCRGDEST